MRRRLFLGSLSGLPLLGGFIAASTPGRAAAMARGRDHFEELGVRPFINAAGTFTAMTASLMPQQVMDAINYASRHFVMLDELHDRVGERIAALVHAEAAIVTSGAASALTGTTQAAKVRPATEKRPARRFLRTRSPPVIREFPR